MRRLSRIVIDGRWRVLLVAGVLVVLAAVFGLGVHDRLTVGGFDDPGSESNEAAELLAEGFDAGQPNFAIVVTTDGDVDDPAVSEAATEITERLAAEEGVRGAFSYWTLGRPAPLRSEDGDQALILANLIGDRAESVEVATRLSPLYSGEQQGLDLQVTGEAEVARQAIEQSEADLQRAELISTPLTTIALVVVFGGLVAAGLPLVVGLVAVIGTFLVLTLITGTTDVSVFALNLTTALGLGLGIDYSLFIVSRYREELARGYPTRTAISHTLQTAGRTVLFSAGTVALSLSALLVFPIVYLRSFAYAGLAVVALAATSAVVVLPAVLAALGPRINAGRVMRREAATDERGFWYRQAHRVMAHPWRYIAAVTVLLLLLAVPFLGLRTGLVDDRVLPESASSREAAADVRDGFLSREAAALSVFVPGGAADPARLDALATELAGIDGVSRVDALTGYYVADATVPPDELSTRFANDTDDTWLSVVPDVEPISAEGEALVVDAREVVAPVDGLISGPSAALVDTKASIAARLPWAVAVIIIATFVLLFFLTGSLLVPLKALVLNVLSLTATFGAMVWIFQEGHLSGLLGVTPTGFIDVFTPLLMFCVAFGLSMDYEVFLISRIKEEYDVDHDNEESVAIGLDRTGRIVTAAALVLSIVFFAIATAEVAIVKLFGVGLALAVLVDAFLIRATLVPAFMRLAGRANWWAPKSLRRFHLRFGVWENEPIDILDRRDDPRAAPSSEAGEGVAPAPQHASGPEDG